MSNPDPPDPPWTARLFKGGFSNARHTLRQWRKNKGFAAATLATLALCIGSTTIIFSMLYALVLKPLPFD